ncbi:sugar ABC transporter substrate-binding protein [Streptosporangium sp. NPDC049644]|uniref:sugar ABC transporter substrate-binding protein n=1 Tax=Streptosporangium sp. NPDC049644 TaxID=3155507 RepID=UPI0034460141
MRKKIVPAVLGVGALLVTAACGSDTAATDATSASASEKKACSVGFANPTGQNSYTGAVVESLKIQVEKYGCKFSMLDSQLNVNQQITDVQTFITQKVDALVIFPLDYTAQKAILTKAADAGIGVFGDNADVNATQADQLTPPLTGQLIDGHLDRAFVEERFKYLSEKLPGGAGKVTFIGFGGPVAPLDKDWELTQEVAKDYPKIELLGRINNPTDDVAGAQAPAAAELTKHPDLSAFISYNDPTAIGAAAAIKNAGKQGKVLSLGAQLQPEGVTALQKQQIDVSWDFEPVVEGKKLAEIVLAWIKGDKAAAAQVVTGGYTKYTRDNIGDFVPTEKQLEALRAE